MFHLLRFYRTYEFKHTKNQNTALLFLIGFFVWSLFAIFTDKLLPEQKINNQVNKSITSKIKIYRSGILIALTMAVHNFPEGIVTFIGSINDLSFGLVIGLAIALHNIPEGMAISVPIYYASGSKRKAFFYSALSGFTEPLGALFCYFVINSYLRFCYCCCNVNCKWNYDIYIHICFDAFKL